jgi:hypothetical protein
MSSICPCAGADGKTAGCEIVQPVVAETVEEQDPQPDFRMNPNSRQG